jgi:hypothetical protein
MNTLSGSIGCSNETYYVTLDMIHSFKIAIFFVLNNRNKDANLRRIPVLLVPTELQRRILCHLCTFENASYETLTKEIGRGRTNIRESMESLIRHRNVEKQKVLSL